MDVALMAGLGKAGGVLALACSAVGSGFGVRAAGAAAVGAWKRCYQLDKVGPFILVTFIGAPLSQTIYGMILMNNIVDRCTLATGQSAEAFALAVSNWPAMVCAGLFGGAAIGVSAWGQGVIGASASDAMSETGKGFGNYLMALGVIETIALFVMVFVSRALA